MNVFRLNVIFTLAERPLRQADIWRGRDGGGGACVYLEKSRAMLVPVSPSGSSPGPPAPADSSRCPPRDRLPLTPHSEYDSMDPSFWSSAVIHFLAPNKETIIPDKRIASLPVQARRGAEILT